MLGDPVAALQVLRRHRHDGQLDPLRSEALGARRRRRPAGVPPARRQIAAGELAHGAEQRHEQIPPGRPLVLEEPRSQDREAALPLGRGDEAVRRGRAHGSLQRKLRGIRRHGQPRLEPEGRSRQGGHAG